MKLTIKDFSGADRGEVEVKFGMIENGRGTQAVHDYIVAYRANQRMGTASTKTMGDVAGSGKKPWRQKGTGRARAGSFASPLWRGGGVTFGPKPRDFRIELPKSLRKLALRKTLSERVKDGDVILVDEFKLGAVKTKNLVAALDSLKLDGSVLLVTSDENKDLQLAARNIPIVEVTTSANLNPYQILRVDKIVMSQSAFQALEKRLA